MQDDEKLLILNEKEAEFIKFFRSQSEETKEKICNSVEEAYIEAKKEHSENCAHE